MVCADNLDACRAYIESLLVAEPPELEKFEAQYRRMPRAQPPIGLQVSTFLTWLIAVMQARKVIELGTALGYSTLSLAAALKTTGGRLIAVESDSEMVAATAKNLQAAGLQDQVDLIHGDAEETLSKLQGSFDLILQDAGKASYPVLLPRCYQLLRPGGVFAMDDALFLPMGVRADLSDPVDLAVRKLFQEDCWKATLLPIGDGLALAWKKFSNLS